MTLLPLRSCIYSIWKRCMLVLEILRMFVKFQKVSIPLNIRKALPMSLQSAGNIQALNLCILVFIYGSNWIAFNSISISSLTFGDSYF